MMDADALARLREFLATEPRHSLGWLVDDLAALLAERDALAAVVDVATAIVATGHICAGRCDLCCALEAAVAARRRAGEE